MTIPRPDVLQRVVDVCSDPAEALALSVTRFLAAGYSTGDVACWDAAYSGAEQLLGTEPAGRLVASLLALVRALRTERIGGWMFLPATCCRVTQDEAAIMRLVSAARAGDAATVSQAAASLTKRPAAPQTEAAAIVVSALLDDVARTLPGLTGSRRTPSLH